MESGGVSNKSIRIADIKALLRREQLLDVRRVQRSTMILVTGDYAIEVRRRKSRGENGNNGDDRSTSRWEYRITFWKYLDGYVAPLLEVIGVEKERVADALASEAASIGDMFLAEYADDIVESLFYYIRNWNTLLRAEIIKEALGLSVSPPGKRGGGWRNGGGETETLEILYKTRIKDYALSLVETLEKFGETDKQEIDMKMRNYADMLMNEHTIQDVINFFRFIYGEELGDLLEIIVTTGITLKIVDRARGLDKPRPLWTLIVAPPSSLKSTVIELIEKSPWVLKLVDITVASLAPADPNREPLIQQMHGKITLFPTLSSIAERDPREAGRLLSILESVYDGYFRRDTAMDTKAVTVDTVIIGSMTPQVYESRFLKNMIAYGSRWLIYRYNLSYKTVDRITELLQRRATTEIMKILGADISSKLTDALESIGRDDLDNVVIPGDLKRDLMVLGDLLANLRVSFRQVKYQEEDENGRKRVVTYEEVNQKDVPIRSRLQLEEFVKANALIRRVPRIVGLPVVDRHAVRLAAKLALGGSSRILGDMVLAIARLGSPAQKELAELLKVSKVTIHRYAQVLYNVEILEDTNPLSLVPKYEEVITKYFLNENNEERGNEA